MLWCSKTLEHFLVWKVVLSNSICSFVKIISKLFVFILFCFPHSWMFFGSDFESLWVQVIKLWVNFLRAVQCLLRIGCHLTIEILGWLEILGRNIHIFCYNGNNKLNEISYNLRGIASVLLITNWFLISAYFSANNSSIFGFSAS